MPHNYISTVNELVVQIETDIYTSEIFLVSATEEDIDTQVLNEMNTVRASRNLKPFVKHSTLTKAAQVHTDYLAKANRLSHYGPNRNTWADRCKTAGYPGASLYNIGENVGMGQKDARTIIKDYLSSPGHLRQIISRDNHHVGSAMSIASNGYKYWCTDFGYGAPDEVVPQPEVEFDRSFFIFT